jgi:hypothetical protein
VPRPKVRHSDYRFYCALIDGNHRFHLGGDENLINLDQFFLCIAHEAIYLAWSIIVADLRRQHLYQEIVAERLVPG